MTIPILVEPSTTGFLASTGGPLNLSAEAVSPEGALAALEAKIESRFERGAVLVHHKVFPPQSPIRMTPLAENPLFDEWMDAIEKFREEKELQDRAIYE